MNLTQTHSTNTEFSTFRQVLQGELVDRCRRNPKYSIRAFAKSLGIVPSALSDMLNGKRTITPASVEKLGLALQLPLHAVERFKNSKNTNCDTEENELAFKQVTQDMFALMTDWCHDAILELIKVDGFEPSASWVSKALGITKGEVNIAVERLVRLNLLEINNEGLWLDKSEGFTTSIKPGLTSAAAKTRQRQILEQAIKALNEVPIELRDQTAMTMAIDPADLPTAINKIKEFRRNLCSFLERNKKPKEVYQLTIGLFPVSQVQKHRGAK